MKKILLICFFTTLAFISKAQTQDSLYDSKDLFKSENDISKGLPQVDVEPQFSGGVPGYYSFLRKNLIYPEDIRGKGINGKVYVAFIVEKDGSLTNIKIVKSLSKDADAEVLRVIKISPKWTPGMVSGEICRANYTLPITFSHAED